ncbi:MAG: hypothetical protein D6705_17655 [Deltaproteobacteria bacterium]|nr:MAG: hypothetical protein D6705_17655 [Deltaproteobacteria bacterium]
MLPSVWLTGVLAVCGCQSGTSDRTTGDTSTTLTGPTSNTGATGPTSGATSVGSATAGSGSGATSATSGPPKFDLGVSADMGGGECGATNDATLTGVVHAPNGTVPVSGALVYVSDTPPAGIPQEVYCAKCEALPPCTPFTLTNPDGSFTLKTSSGAGKYLAVVKGQFMRIRPIDIAPGDTPLDASYTDLPGENDPANGLYIPKIALGMSSPDSFWLILGKVGLGQVDGNDNLVPGTEQFDIYADGLDPATYGFTSQGPIENLLSDPTKLAQYHIIFTPCISDPAEFAVENDPTPVLEWVAAGGRIYATDYAEDVIEALFPDYQTFNGEPPDPVPVGFYDSDATVLDANLLAWLEALPDDLKDVNPLNGGGTTWPTLFDLPTVRIIDNYTGIVYPLPSIQVPDGMGGMIDVGHKAWIEGPWPGPGGISPLAVMGQYGCGRLHFTSYHTVGAPHKGMIPQELIMLYSILEVGVCTDQVPPEG